MLQKVTGALPGFAGQLTPDTCTGKRNALPTTRPTRFDPVDRDMMALTVLAAGLRHHPIPSPRETRRRTANWGDRIQYSSVFTASSPLQNYRHWWNRAENHRPRRRLVLPRPAMCHLLGQHALTLGQAHPTTPRNCTGRSYNKTTIATNNDRNQLKGQPKRGHCPRRSGVHHPRPAQTLIPAHSNLTDTDIRRPQVCIHPPSALVNI